MTDDIVTRLRRDVDSITYIRGVEPTGMITNEAADEIERLRKEADVWRGICERFAESDPRFDAFRLYFKAVRGE